MLVDYSNTRNGIRFAEQFFGLFLLQNRRITSATRLKLSIREHVLIERFEQFGAEAAKTEKISWAALEQSSTSEMNFE